MCYYVPESKTVLLNLKKKNQYRQRFYIVNAYPIKTNFMINPTHYIMLPICCPQDFKFIKALWQSVEWTLFEPYVLCSIFPTTHQKTKPCGKKNINDNIELFISATIVSQYAKEKKYIKNSFKCDIFSLWFQTELTIGHMFR